MTDHNQLAMTLADQSVVCRRIVKMADPGWQKSALSPGEAVDNVSQWANEGDGAQPTLRHGAIGAGIGGLGTLLVSKLLGRKWKDALWDSILGAGVGGLGGAGYKVLSDSGGSPLSGLGEGLHTATATMSSSCWDRSRCRRRSS